MAKSETDTEAEPEDGHGPVRRAAYLGGAVAGMAGLAGCFGADDDDEENGEEENGEENGVDDPEADVELGMVVDLQRCSGCTACNIACKNENNTQQGHAWSHHLTVTDGEFPDVSYEYVPTLCNQCRDAPCVEGCPRQGDALYYGEGGITMLDPDECIGCWQCVDNCPYGRAFANDEETHQFWRDDTAVIDGLTATPQGTVEQSGGDTIGTYNPSRESGEHESPLRWEDVAEKCTFCVHRVEEGELPACVEACPSDARIFGDLNDEDSSVSEVLEEYDERIVDEWYDDDFGTDPKVKYVREFDGSEAGDPLGVGKGEVPDL